MGGHCSHVSQTMQPIEGLRSPSATDSDEKPAYPDFLGEPDQQSFHQSARQ
jgi:hypothetical protein